MGDTSNVESNKESVETKKVKNLFSLKKQIDEEYEELNIDKMKSSPEKGVEKDTFDQLRPTK